jgi:hypothetical protein
MQAASVNKLINKHSKCEKCESQNIEYDVHNDTFSAKCECTWSVTIKKEEIE